MKEVLNGKVIGVFFGGRSPEHDVSIITGELIISELKKMGHVVVPVYVAKDGTWYSSPQLSELKFFKDTDSTDSLKKLKKYTLSLSAVERGQLVLKTGGLFGKEVVIDFAFPAFHGPYGEDGTFQGLCEFIGVPYAGCGVYASSVAMSKIRTKQLLKQNSIPTTAYKTCSKDEFLANKDEVIATLPQGLTYPLFVKPAHGGSSIGISRVRSERELADALELALYYDTHAVIENGVTNLKDLTCAVLEQNGTFKASVVQESVLGESGFFDYEKKYLEDGGAQTGNAENSLVIPANIDTALANTVQKYAIQICKLVEGNGTLRVDFLLNESSGELFANEINTLPGTLYHHLWEKSEVSLNVVIGNMMTAGTERFEKQKGMATDFSSSILSQANSLKLKQQKDS